MFKDFYKSANDDIKPAPELLSKVLKGAEKKKKTFFYHFRLAPVAAIIALAILLSNMIIPADDGAQKPILPVAENDTTYYFLSGKTSEEESKTSNYNADIAENTPVVTESSNVVMSVNSSENFAYAQASARSSGGGGGASANAHAEISAKDYFAALGFSPDMLDLPDGLTADFDIGTKVSGVENTFTYSGDFSLSVTTSSDATVVNSFLNSEQYEKSVFGDKRAVILYDGSVYEAYIIHSSGTALKIVTDMPEENLKNLLISAAK